MIGQIVGNYRIEKRLGEGGMGEVYQGVDLMLEREVAIKALRPELTTNPELVERFRSEAIILAKLNHPNIATLYNLLRQGDNFYMVLEYVRGKTLDKVIAERGAIPCNLAIPLFCQVLDGIDYAHELGIVHRDIKPANIMLTEKGRLKVLDFGIARILGSAHMTKSGHVVGTIEYMSPEQIKGKETDSRSDIYSLGVLLYEMVTGRAPFSSENEFELMRMQIEQEPVPPTSVDSRIPAEVERAILRAMAKRPEDRFQTAGEFRDTLLAAGYAPLNTHTSGSHETHTSDPFARTLQDVPLKSISVVAPLVAAPAPKETRVAGLSVNSAVAAPDGLVPMPPVGAGISQASYNEGRSGISQIAIKGGRRLQNPQTPSHPPSHIKLISEDLRWRIYYDQYADVSVIEDTSAQLPQYSAWNGTSNEINKNPHTDAYQTMDEAIQAAITLRWY